jgi:hypothetical protein
LQFRISRAGELLYDAAISPKYTAYPTTREESKRFCGDRALVELACVRGSSVCAPFASSCDGPEDCPRGSVCCLDPDLAREHGPRAASECKSESRCLNGFAHIACHEAAECPKGMACSDTALAADFKTAIVGCGAAVAPMPAPAPSASAPAAR